MMRILQTQRGSEVIRMVDPQKVYDNGRALMSCIVNGRTGSNSTYYTTDELLEAMMIMQVANLADAVRRFDKDYRPR